jgi:hypothetical protein
MDVRLVALPFLLAGVLAGCASAPIAVTSPKPSITFATPVDRGGSYISYAECQTDPQLRRGTLQVLFFFDPDCAECLAVDESLTMEGVPEGLTVIKVDFDTYTDAREKYGVESTMTFVQIDDQEHEVDQWTGSANADEILTRVRG